MARAWLELAPRITGLYEGYTEDLLAGRPVTDLGFAGLQELTDPIAQLSRAILTEAEPALAEGGDLRELVPELLLAASAVDAALASDLARLDPASEQGANRGLLTDIRIRLGAVRQAGRPEAAGEEPPTLQELLAERRELIALVDAEFAQVVQDDELPPIAGAAPRPRSRPALSGDVQDTLEDLLATAHVPTSEFVKGLFASATLGLGHAVSLSELAGAIHHLNPNLARIIRPAPRMLKEHVTKVGALCPEGWILNEAATAILERLSVRAMLENVSDSSRALDKARERIENAPEITWNATDALRSDLESLDRRYKKHLKWIRRSSKALRWGATPLSAIATATLPGPGVLVMPAVFTVGAGYVTYSLVDRVDARNLWKADLVEGVIPLVRRHIPAA
jgi:hypothetical protein